MEYDFTEAGKTAPGDSSAQKSKGFSPRSGEGYRDLRHISDTGDSLSDESDSPEYRFFINGIQFDSARMRGEKSSLPVITSGMKNSFTLYLENRGAPCKSKLTLKLRLTREDESYISRIYADSREWLPGRETAVVCEFCPADLPKGEYELAVGLFDGDAPVCFSVKPEYSSGSWAVAGTVKIVY